MKTFTLFAKGALVGATNIIPGTSGATVAVMLKVYTDVLQSINSIFTNPKNSLPFLLIFGFGMVFGIVAFGSMLNQVMRWGFVFNAGLCGLIFGSVPSALRRKSDKPMQREAVLVSIAHILVFAAVVVILFLISPNREADAAPIWIILLCGFLASAALILPGFSGAMIVVAFGLYGYAVETVSLIPVLMRNPAMDTFLEILMFAAPFGLGMLIGVFVGTKGVLWLIRTRPEATASAIGGLVIGTGIIVGISAFRYFDFGFGSIVFGIVAFVAAAGIASRF